MKILVSFAASHSNLSMLEEEEEQLRKALQTFERKGNVKLKITHVSSQTEIIRDFNQLHNDIVVFHYSGHNDYLFPNIENKRLIKNDLELIISEEKQLKLVFLNRCSSMEQVKKLIDNGVPAVIATTDAINDKRALDLSINFYTLLADGKSIKEAFQSASNHISHIKNKPFIKIRERISSSREKVEFPWALYIKEESILDWQIQDVNSPVTPTALSNKYDDFIFHEFELKEQEIESMGLEQDVSLIKIPILLNIKKNFVPPSHSEHFEIVSGIGNIIAALATREAINSLILDDNVISIEGSKEAGVIECNDSVPFIKADLIHDEKSWNEKGDECIIAIIDSGIDILHEAFKDYNGNTRIIGIWDQKSNEGNPPKGFSFGTYYNHSEIKQFIENQSVPYHLKDIEGHGTHVASIAAGSKVGAIFNGGVSPQSEILVVIPSLQTKTNDPISIGYSVSHLSALSFIKEQALARNKPVVVNVSLGMNAGSHDGTTLLEAAFDEFTERGRYAGRAIVKSAGNERGQRGHVKIVMNAFSKEVVSWESLNRVRRQDILEFWFPNHGELTFRIGEPTTPGFPINWSEEVNQANKNLFGKTRNGNLFTITYTPFHKDNGLSRLLITIHRGTANQIKEGIWQLEIKSAKLSRTIEIHGWVERVDSRPINFQDWMCEEVTLSIPGTAYSVIAVSAIEASMPFSLHPASSLGPTRDNREKPNICAPGVNILGAKSGTKRDFVYKSGTSMAAPHVTGAIALIFSWFHKNSKENQVNVNQISRLIESSLSKNQIAAGWTNGMGFGPLNIEVLFNELKETIISYT